MGNWHQDERVSGEFSECGKFRFWLKVEFDPIIPAREKGTLAITGLNPSKADLTRDDQTMRKGCNWAKWKGYDSLLMLNAFPFRATLPKDLKAAEDPFGGQTAWKLFQLIKGCTLVAAWGMDGKYRGRAPEILEAAKVLGINVWCFGKNKDGSPLHPCYARLPDELIRYDL